jgi:hypothetical protein
MLTIDNKEEIEGIVDPGSQIIAMSEGVCYDIGLLYNPSIKLDIQSANGDVDQSLGLCKGTSIRFLTFPLLPTLPLFICISPTPLYHLQGPHQKPMTFVFKVRWLSGCRLTESCRHSISSSAHTLAALDKPRMHWDMSMRHYGTLCYHMDGY